MTFTHHTGRLQPVPARLSTQPWASNADAQERDEENPSKFALLAVVDACMANRKVSFKVGHALIKQAEASEPTFATPCLVSARFSLRFIMDLKSGNDTDCIRQMFMHVLHIRNMAQEPVLQTHWARFCVDPGQTLWPEYPVDWEEEKELGYDDEDAMVITTERLLQDAYTALIPCELIKVLEATPEADHGKIKFKKIIRLVDKRLHLRKKPEVLQERIAELQQVWDNDPNYKDDKESFLRTLLQYVSTDKLLPLLRKWALNAFVSLPPTYFDLSQDIGDQIHDFHQQYFEFLPPNKRPSQAALAPAPSRLQQPQPATTSVPRPAAVAAPAPVSSPATAAAYVKSDLRQPRPSSAAPPPALVPAPASAVAALTPARPASTSAPAPAKLSPARPAAHASAGVLAPVPVTVSASALASATSIVARPAATPTKPGPDQRQGVVAVAAPLQAPTGKQVQSEEDTDQIVNPTTDEDEEVQRAGPGRLPAGQGLPGVNVRPDIVTGKKRPAPGVQPTRKTLTGGAAQGSAVPKSPDSFAEDDSPVKRFSRPRKRRRWSALEEMRLGDLYKAYGSQWAKIKIMDEEMALPLLKDRSQVDIKDKVRNLINANRLQVVEEQ